MFRVLVGLAAGLTFSRFISPGGAAVNRRG